MHKIIVSETAIQDLKEIKKFIKLNDPDYSEIVTDTILLYLHDIVSNFPNIGIRIPNNNLSNTLRVVVEPKFKYRIFYQIVGNKIEITHIYKRKKDKN